MNKTQKTRCFDVLLILAISLGVASNAVRPEMVLAEDIKKSSVSVEDVKKKIRSLAETHDIAGLDNYAHSLDGDWRKSAGDVSYREAIGFACTSLIDYRFDSQLQYKLAAAYASKILADKDNTDMDLELRIVSHILAPEVLRNLERKPTYIDVPVEVKDTKEGLILTAMRHVDSQLDLVLAASEPPPRRAPVPEGINLAPGDTPASIKDPSQRSKYEAAVAANLAARKRYRFQVLLSRTNDKYSPILEKHLVKSFIEQGVDSVKAKEILSACKISEIRQNRITNALSKDEKIG